MSNQIQKTKKIVSFDFDGTLSRKDVQEYAKELLNRGIDVWVVTARYDDLHRHMYSSNPSNEDLWKIVDELNIPRWKVRFTCMESKSEYLENTRVAWHLDNDEFEQEMINGCCEVFCVYVLDDDWKEQCERILKKRL